MTLITHIARIIGPVSYLGDGGTTLNIPLGPCLIDQTSQQLIDIVWGTHGQSSVALPVEAVLAARQQGHLVLLT